MVNFRAQVCLHVIMINIYMFFARFLVLFEANQKNEKNQIPIDLPFNRHGMHIQFVFSLLIVKVKSWFSLKYC